MAPIKTREERVAQLKGTGRSRQKIGAAAALEVRKKIYRESAAVRISESTLHDQITQIIMALEEISERLGKIEEKMSEKEHGKNLL